MFSTFECQLFEEFVKKQLEKKFNSALKNKSKSKESLDTIIYHVGHLPNQFCPNCPRCLLGNEIKNVNTTNYKDQ